MMGSRGAFNLTALALLVHVWAVAIPVRAAPDPGCAVWVVRNALGTPAAWREALDAVERRGCERVYLQVSGRWDAYFPSRVWPGPETPVRGWDDPFGRALDEAHDRGIEVHAWVNALLAWSAPEPPSDPAHVFLRQPEWFVVDTRGRSMRSRTRAELDRAGLRGEGWFLDPAREDVRTELRRFVLEVALTYPVDGIHLDYIRYPTGWAPPGGADAITYLVALVAEDLRSVRPGAELSAAVMPRADEAVRSFGQDWATWIERGLVDEAVPMVYRDSAAAVSRVIASWPPSVPRSRVRVGIRIDRLGRAELDEVERRLAETHVAGLALFSHNLMLDASGR